MSSTGTTVDPRTLRTVLGHVPTGVAVITAIGPGGGPVGMAVGTFTSVSLAPPLIGFFPARDSSTFPGIRAANSFCVNVLAAHQAELGRSFSARDTDRFSGVAWSPSGCGAPRLDGVAAWIDCDLETVTDAGDHFLVLGRVRDLAGHPDRSPLVFLRGAFAGVTESQHQPE